MNHRMTGDHEARPAPRPTEGDASIVLQLARWSTELGMTEALSFLLSEAFPTTFEAFRSGHPAGSSGDEQFLTICRFYETVGTLWKHDLINEDLLFDWLAIALVWERLEAIAVGHRAERHNESLWENFEALAGAQAAAELGSPGEPEA